MKNLYSHANSLRAKYQNDPDGLAQYLVNFYFVYPDLPNEVLSGMNILLLISDDDFFQNYHPILGYE